jgi:hypothetical protein
MTKMIKLATVVGASVIACASAKAVDVLTFNGLQNLEPIASFYDGGLGGFGSGPGPDYGITFGGNSLAIISSAAGGTGNFGNAPTGNTIAFFLNGTADDMEVPGGFNTGFSFYYAANYSGSVTVWSGLDGSGTELASIALSPTADPYYVWQAVGVTFSGTAESALFGGVANYIGFDDITLGSSTAGGNVPDNTGAGIYVLAALGLAGATWASRKQAIATL